MDITLDAELEAALTEAARRQGVTVEALVVEALRARFVPPKSPAFEPQDEWERRLLSIATDCGTSIPDWALSREEMYD